MALPLAVRPDGTDPLRGMTPDQCRRKILNCVARSAQLTEQLQQPGLRASEREDIEDQRAAVEWMGFDLAARLEQVGEVVPDLGAMVACECGDWGGNPKTCRKHGYGGTDPNVADRARRPRIER